MHDLIVAGGGPVGLAVAIEAARRGWDVLVVEPRVGVLDKACGEGLMPAGVDALRALGVAPPVHRVFRGIRYVRGGREVDADFSGGEGWGIRRTALHAALREAAERAGVRWAQGQVRQLTQREDRVEAAGHKARWLVAADGLASPVRAALGLTLPRTRPARFGLRRHFAVAPWSDRVEVHWADDAEAYVTPVAEGLVGVAFLFGEAARARDLGSPEPPWSRLMDRFPDLAARLTEPASAARGAGPFAVDAKQRVAGRVLLAGDAAGYLDPLTGEGVKLGLLGARAVVEALAADRPEDWEVAWRALYRPYERATSTLLAVTRPVWVRRLMLPFLQLFPGVMRRALAQLEA